MSTTSVGRLRRVETLHVPVQSTGMNASRSLVGGGYPENPSMYTAPLSEWDPARRAGPPLRLWRWRRVGGRTVS
jgi:hypothetical protein